MHHVFKLAPLPLLAGIFVACSGGVESDPVDQDPAVAADPLTSLEGEVTLALEEGEGLVEDSVNKGRRRHHERRQRGRRYHRRWNHHPPPRPAPPAAESCEVAGQSFAAGAEVPSGDSCNTCTCSDGEVGCTRAACGPVICALFIEVPDGVCSRFPLDPCLSQDPDCTPSPDAGSCEVAGETFANGSPVPSGDSCNSCACNEGSVLCTLALCQPVACAELVEASDGVCARFPLDPCQFQDPDCIDPDEPVEPTTPIRPDQP